MIYEVRKFYVANNLTPSDDDIREAIEIAKRDNVVVHLTWSGPGWEWYGQEHWGYTREITAESTFEEVKESLPKMYGI